jgi:hypothetical protein
MKKSDQINEIAQALSKAQIEFETADRVGLNPHFRSKYATLESIWAACRGPLSKNGLSVIQSPSTTDVGHVTITTLLAHSSGQWFEGSFTLIPKDNGPQAYGSAVTYGRRYALMAMVGIATDDGDDDGNAASKIEPSSAGISVKESQILAEPGLYICKFGKYKGLSVRDIPFIDLKGYVGFIKNKAHMEGKPVTGQIADFLNNADAHLVKTDPDSFTNQDQVDLSFGREPGQEG